MFKRLGTRFGRDGAEDVGTEGRVGEEGGGRGVVREKYGKDLRQTKGRGLVRLRTLCPETSRGKNEGNSSRKTGCTRVVVGRPSGMATVYHP